VPLPLAGALFFLSGAAALLDQTLWQRILALTSGVGVVSSAIIVGGFMLGLGVGSEVGGRLSARVSAKRALIFFALAEGAVGVFSLCSTFLYYDVLYKDVAPGLSGIPAVAAVQIGALFLPTFAMGLSFPLLARACVSSPHQAADSVTWLFGANVLGSAFGALATPWVLLRFLSIPQALSVSASFSFLASAGAVAGLRSAGRAPAKDAPSSSEARPPKPRETGEPTAGVAVWCLLFLASGFVGLGLEMVWFRVVEVTLKGTAFAFGTVLGLYLLGLGGGAVFGRRLVKGRPPLSSFVALQCLAILWAIGALLAVAYVPAGWPLAGSLVAVMGSYFGRLGPGADPETFLWFIGLPAFFFLPATFAMGLSYRALQEGLEAGTLEVGRRTGLLQSANILGSMMGSLVIGLIVMPRIGTVGILRSLAAIVAALALIGAARTRRRSLALMACLVVIAATGLPSNRNFWILMHGRAREGTVITEDASSIVALSQKRRGGFWLFVNGVGHSELPYGGVHTALGALGLIIHESPQDVAVIGLGSGNTIWAALGRSDVRHAVTYEIASAQYPALLEVRSRNRFAELDQLFRDKRLDLRFEDGRLGLLRSTETFDVIELDALYPWAAWSGYIYSQEFFEICRRRLKPKGLLVTWAPTERIQRTVRSVFPYIRIFENDIVVASVSAIGLADVARPGLREWFGDATLDEIARIGATGAEWTPRAGSINTDLHPRDEFASAR
jgi:spermidine synthase